MVLVDSHGISRVPRYSGTGRESAHCRLRGCHPLWPIVPDRSTNLLIGNSLVSHQTGPTTPPSKLDGLGYVRVRSPLLAESLLFSVPPGTEMVHFPGLPSATLWIQVEILRNYPEWVAPFGDPRVKACLRLTEAFRSLPRPSSTPGAKAFTVRP
jgi:hypothetical protein